MPFLAPGDPRETHLMKDLQGVSALCDFPAIMYVTTTTWAALAAELRAQYSSTPTPANFASIRIGKLTVVNSGSDDQEACDTANKLDAEKNAVQWKRDAWRVG